ncbi:MAG: protein-L-isoaspartate O-methyltransferase [Patescibacteria group bacterium]
MDNLEWENLINSLIEDGYLKTPAIIEAFKNIDRIDFMLEEYKNEAYINAPLPIGFSQTISQPLTVAFMLELLQPKEGEKILDIGAGSGWVSSLLAYIVGNPPVGDEVRQGRLSGGGKIISIERISELKEMAEKNISKYNYIEKGIIEIVLGDGSKGYKKEAPYDKIIAGAAAETDIPEEWKKQLKIGGRIVAPIGHSIAAIDKINKNEYSKREYFGFTFVPLIRE